MRSSRLLRLLLPCLILSACSLRLNDTAEKVKMNVNLGGGCLSDSGRVLGEFAAGTASEADLNGLWDCNERAVNTFLNHAETDASESYRANDIAKFLTKYFLKGKEVPTALVLETMALKQSLIGGNADGINRKELRELLRLMKAGRRFTQRLRPHMPISFESFAERNYSPEQFEAAIAEFQAAAIEMGEALKQTQASYTLDHFGQFFSESGKFLYAPNDPQGAWVETLVKWTKALRPAKAIFISPPREEIRAADWATIYQMGPRYYSLYLRTRFYAHRHNQYYYGDGLAHLEALFDDGIQLFGQLLDQHADGEIRSSEIDDLLGALHAAGLMPRLQPTGRKGEATGPRPIELETARAAVKLFFGKLFRNQDSGKEYSIRRENLAQLSRNFHFATEGLRALEAAYRNKLGDDNFARQGLTPTELQELLSDKLLPATLLHDQTSKLAIESLRKSATEIETVFPGQSMHVTIPGGASRAKLSLAHMAKIHLLRSFNRLLIGAYAGPDANALSSEQISALLGDIFPILKECGYADEKTRKDVDGMLFQASLLLPSSDGDQGLTMNEAIELESLLVSTVAHASKIHAKLAELCSAQGHDDRGNVTIAAACFRKQWMENSDSIWSYLPGLATYFKRLPERDQEAFFGRLEKFLRKGRPATAEFTLGDTRSFLLLPYYVELLFYRFDANHNGVLENEEAERAYPVFQPFLAAKASAQGKTDPKDHHAIYMYLLAYRQLPTADTWSDALSYAWRRYVAGDKSFRADRGQVVEIFEKLLTL